MRNVSIRLLTIGTVKNEIGREIESVTQKKQVLAEKKSVHASEFYQSISSEFKPEIVFVIWPHEYNGETLLEYGAQKYHVIRTFQKSQRELELICEVRLNGN